ncbi:VOC family protein [Flavobacterium sp.]|uniref:VOC family protein n=1 Tax=Flavobacterium sp. TaxID=239 RepID=UPI003D0EFFC7
MNLNQVTVSVTDIEKSITFYETLGLKLIVKAPHYARFECPEGDSTFSIALADSVVHQGTTIYFETEKLDAVVADLIQKGISFEQFPTDERYLWREAILLDPDHNKIKLFFAGDNRKNPPWRISK